VLQSVQLDLGLALFMIQHFEWNSFPTLSLSQPFSPSLNFHKYLCLNLRIRSNSRIWTREINRLVGVFFIDLCRGVASYLAYHLFVFVYKNFPLFLVLSYILLSLLNYLFVGFKSSRVNGYIVFRWPIIRFTLLSFDDEVWECYDLWNKSSCNTNEIFSVLVCYSATFFHVNKRVSSLSPTLKSENPR
jgi:hypothetical protein